jgi:hypothetical protein
MLAIDALGSGQHMDNSRAVLACKGSGSRVGSYFLFLSLRAVLVIVPASILSFALSGHDSLQDKRDNDRPLSRTSSTPVSAGSPKQPSLDKPGWHKLRLSYAAIGHVARARKAKRLFPDFPTVPQSEPLLGFSMKPGLSLEA